MFKKYGAAVLALLLTACGAPQPRPQAPPAPAAPEKPPPAPPAKAPAPVKKGGLTAAGRKALSNAMKKRWAAKKKAAAKGK